MSKEGEPSPVLVHVVGLDKERMKLNKRTEYLNRWIMDFNDQREQKEPKKGPPFLQDELPLFPYRINRPDIRGRVLLAAARALLEKEPQTSIVFSGGSLHGESMSDLYAYWLNRKTGDIYHDSIHTNRDDVVTTAAELRTLEEWLEKAVCLAWSVHVPRIKLLVEKMSEENKDKVVVLSPEEVLGTIPNERNSARYLRIIEGLKDTPEEKKWEQYEKRQIWILKHILFAPSLLNFVARFYRPSDLHEFNK